MSLYTRVMFLNETLCFVFNFLRLLKREKIRKERQLQHLAEVWNNHLLPDTFKAKNKRRWNHLQAKDARKRMFFRAIIPWAFLLVWWAWMSRPVCPGAVSAMDKLMMRDVHHRQLDIRLRQRDAMLYTMQVRDKRRDLRAGGSKRVEADWRAFERIRAAIARSIDTRALRELENFGKRVDASSGLEEVSSGLMWIRNGHYVIWDRFEGTENLARSEIRKFYVDPSRD